MMNYLLIALVFSFSVQMFSYSSSLGKIKRVFEGFDFSLAQQAVLAKGQNEIPYGPFFYKTAWKRVTVNYFKTNLDPYLRNGSYTLTQELSDPYIIDGKKTTYFKRATLYFNATFQGIYHYENSKSFIIKEKK